MMDLTRRLRDRLANEHLMFAYRGEVNGENSVMLLTLLDKEMELSEFGTQGRKRLFMFVLENLQNISRHGTSTDYDNMSLVVYTKTDDGYTVTTGNAIDVKEVAELRANLENINKLDPDKIREVYREMLKDSDMSHKGGAGLGLMEMARKTGNKLDFDFIPINDGYSYFILSKTVDAGGKGLPSPGLDSEFSGRRVMTLEHLMRTNDIYFIWAGHITHDINIEMLNLNEIRMHENDIEQNLHKRAFTTLIELLQNIAQHGTDKEAERKYGMPVAMIRNTPDTFIITSGNLIRNEGIEFLKQKLDMINNHDEEGLKDLLRIALAGQDMSEDSTGFMGLLEMARRSGNKLMYEFEEINEEYSYYVLTVVIRSRDHKAR